MVGTECVLYHYAHNYYRGTPLLYLEKSYKNGASAETVSMDLKLKKKGAFKMLLWPRWGRFGFKGGAQTLLVVCLLF